MTARDWLNRLGLRTTPQQGNAMRFLESRGRRFLVDFGIDNAIDKAREEWRKIRANRKPRGTSW